ncbi:serine carboxypeptidase-like 10 [Ipomoea triloba]|uniref:serine carboxypeptidase-like 10 n=1 Tax=Ipomoea triloba TaxID=35885 RepID=UPI00125DF44C|nr:serine carboxypeptidase-like 10 [Ipomoea triloba]
MKENMQRHYYCRFCVFLVLIVVLLKLESCHKHAVEAACGLPVNFLPGFDGPLPFQLQTGYIGVQNEEIQLFYYFVKSDSNPQEDPLILWITGGKTCSALRTIFQQIGPLLVEPVEYNGSLPRLRPFPYSWTKFASIIFLDSPAGTGFSYATKSVQNSDLSAASNAYEFLQKWLIDHPEFLSNPFYVAGHSYAGLIVPIITEMISNGIESGVKPLIQLQGYILGSPRAFEAQDNYRVPFAHGMGLITDQLYESLKKNCKEDYMNTNSTSLHCQRDLQTFNQLTESINHKHILEPICLSGSDSTMSSLIKLPVQKPLHHDLYTKLKIDPFFLCGLQCRDEWSELTPYWANDYHVQMALHVRQGTKEKWELCSDSVPYTSSIGNAIPYHMRLSKKGYRSLIYSGDHEMMSTCLSNEAWIKLLNYSIIDDWRSWMIEGQVAGYTTTYANNMTFVTVKGGGHVAPDYRPFESQVMFKRWISYENL